MARLTIPVRLRWSDIDGYGHVNNAAMLTLLEEARIAAFWASPGEAADGGQRDGVGDDGAADDGAGTHGAGGTGDGGNAGRNGGGGKILDAGPGASTATFIAHQEVEYLSPLPYTLEPLAVQMWLARMGGASIDVCYEVPGPDGVAARAMTTLVLVDPATGRPRRITDAERAAWQSLVEEPVAFRRNLSR
ncbi:acyl-CoA thioesterase [Georgenia faecalis]|uniref:Acyl-CoA thioesterase n=1 Tax=Georgenia faecalis TaxID=2483799 RepID=A0ABV9DCP2_9MICO|nr:thioesterase family protein [Georgenia faecalis]